MQPPDVIAGEHGAEPPPLPPPAASPGERAFAGGIAVLGVLVFGVACWLDPYDSEGRPLASGTHRQLGLPACRMLAACGIACPSCGMTTAVSLVMHGDPRAAWQANSAGLPVAFGGLAATAWLAGICLLGRRPAALSAGNVVLSLILTGASAVVVRYLIAMPWRSLS